MKVLRPRPRLILAIVAVLLLSALVVGVFGRRMAQAALVRSPNYHVKAFAPIPGEIRVEVSSPPASLSLELMNVEAPRGTVFVLHGIRDRKESERGFGRQLQERGFRAVLVDLRGHGRSTGQWLSYGVIESQDLKRVLDDLTERKLVDGSVGVMGISYGAATAIEWASIDPRIKAVVAIAPFASLRAVVPGYSPIELPSSTLNGIIDDAAKEANFDPDLASPSAAITKTKAPTLLIHGRDDSRIPFWHAVEIADAGGGHTELIVVPGEDHDSIGADRTGTIRDRGFGWFVKHL